MELSGESLDAVLHALYRALDTEGRANEGSRGQTRELLAVTLRITKPRARISRSENRGKPFSALGELLWYLSGSDTLAFIEPYVSEYRKDSVDGVIQGAYGPRLLCMRGHIDQLNSVVTLLREKPGSRRAVIQLFNAEDIATRHKEIPCTTTLQFHIRDRRLHLSVTLRSNDAYWGLPHDVFCFTMLQEMMARRLGVELGEYYQHVGSMHVYERHYNGMRAYIAEGVQQTSEMPAMPEGDAFEMVGLMLTVEAQLRSGVTVEAGHVTADPYWADIVRLLQVFWAREWAEDGYNQRLEELKGELAAPAYKPYVEGRMYMKPRVVEQQYELR